MGDEYTDAELKYKHTKTNLQKEKHMKTNWKRGDFQKNE